MGQCGNSGVEPVPIVIEFDEFAKFKVEFQVATMLCDAIEFRTGDADDLRPFDAMSNGIASSAPNSAIVSRDDGNVGIAQRFVRTTEGFYDTALNEANDV